MNTPDDEQPQAAPGTTLFARLREDRERVPAEVAQRLERARRDAVAQLAAQQTSTRMPPRPGWPVWMGSLAGAAAALLVAVIVLRPGADDGFERLLLADPQELAVVAELELLEDLDFLIWLDQELADAGPG